MVEQLPVVEDGGDEGEDVLQMAFFIMPGHALKSLRDELEIQGGDALANDMLYRYGIRCGEGMITRMGMKCDTMEDIASTIPALWAGVGLGRITVDTVAQDQIKVRFHESVESLALGRPKEPKCHFTRGYLTGMASGLSGKDFKTEEVQCSEDWSEQCFILKSAGEYLKPVVELAVPAVAQKAVAAAVATTRVSIERGTSYLVEEEDPNAAYELFVEEISHGGQGLCITRDFPNKVRKMYGLSQTPILWLSNAEQEYAVEPVQLGKLYHKIEDFLKKADHPIVMITGLEYLIVQNNFHSALKFLQLVRDQISIHDSVLIACISPSTMGDKDLKLIEREMEPLHMGGD
jgi:predicted hydrocarbon binding protein